MITTIISLLGLAGSVAGALGSIGGVLKLLGKFAPSVASTVLSNPLFGVIGKFAEGFFELIWKVLWAVLSYIGAWLAGGFDHISKDARSFAILMAVAWGSYQIGGIGRPVLETPPAAKSAPAKAAPAPTAKQPVSDPFDWITNALGL